MRNARASAAYVCSGLQCYCGNTEAEDACHGGASARLQISPELMRRAKVSGDEAAVRVNGEARTVCMCAQLSRRCIICRWKAMVTILKIGKRGHDHMYVFVCVCFSLQWLPLLHAIHDVVLLHLAAWPAPRVARKALRTIWSARHTSRDAHTEDEEAMHQRFPRNARVFLCQQLAVMRCPVPGAYKALRSATPTASTTRVLLLVLAWLLAETDFFVRIARNEDDTVIRPDATSSRSTRMRWSAAAAAETPKAMMELQQADNQEDAEEEQEDILCEDPAHASSACRAASLGMETAQRLVVSTWAESVNDDSNDDTSLDAQVHRTASLHGKLWKSVGSLAALQAGRYKMLHSMREAIHGVTSERAAAENEAYRARAAAQALADTSARRSKPTATMTKTTQHTRHASRDEESEPSVVPDDANLDAYKLSLLRDRAKMQAFIASLDAASFRAAACELASTHATVFFEWVESMIMAADSDTSDDKNCFIDSAIPSTSPFSGSGMSSTELHMHGLHVASGIEEQLKAKKELLEALIANLRSDEQSTGIDADAMHSTSPALHTLSGIDTSALASEARLHARMEPYVPETRKLPKDVTELFARTRRHREHTSTSSFSSSSSALQSSSHGEDPPGSTAPVHLDTKDYLLMHASLLESLDTMRALHRQEIVRAVASVTRGDPSFIVSM